MENYKLPTIKQEFYANQIKLICYILIGQFRLTYLIFVISWLVSLKFFYLILFSKSKSMSTYFFSQ